MSKTLFYARKSVYRHNDSWLFDIDLIFEGKAISLTQSSPIRIDGEEVTELCPGADIEKGDRFSDTVSIENKVQFERIFRSVLTDEATELLCDVYSGRYWYARFIDTDGIEKIVQSYITDDFTPIVTMILRDTDRFWMELHTGTTRMTEDWTITIDDDITVFDNIHDGMRPIGSVQAQSIIDSATTVNAFTDREDFDGTVMRCGNSLVIKVTEQCRHMGLDVGDDVSVTLNVNTSKDDSDLSVFIANKWTPIDNPDDLCHRDGCDLQLVKKFLDDFHIIGTVDRHSFGSMVAHEGLFSLFDHMNCLKDKDGNNLIVCQPYDDKGNMLKWGQDWARKNGCTVEEHKEYSWHRPPETTLLVFRKRINPDWKLPTVQSSIPY